MARQPDPAKIVAHSGRTARQPDPAKIVAQLMQDEPTMTLGAITELRAELESAEAKLVSEAMAAGASWSQIGAALGVTKQAAHARHKGSVARPPAVDKPLASEGRQVAVTLGARRAVRLAREEAGRLGLRAVGTEHLLLGVIAVGEGPAVAALAALGVSLESARRALEPTLEIPQEDAQRLSAGGERTRARAEISHLARTVLEQSLRETLERHESRLGAEHLLLALLRDPRGGAARTLERLRVSVDSVQRQLERALSLEPETA